MSIRAPSLPVDHEDYGYLCEEALEPFLMAMQDRLEARGREPMAAAQEILAAAADMGGEGFLQEELRQIVAWAVVIGWTGRKRTLLPCGSRRRTAWRETRAPDGPRGRGPVI